MKTPRTCLSLFCGLGGGARGFAQAGWHTVGVDLDEAALADYRTLTGHPAHTLDLSTATPEQLRACVGTAPDVLLTSPPCQAFSGCLPLSAARTAPYQELSSLAERGIWLALEAWPDAPPRLILLENVPRILSRGRAWLDAVASMLRAYGYAWRETTHDCAELGGLAQHRRRFLGVARLQRCPEAPERVVEELLYEPPHQRIKSVGEVLGALPVPGPWANGQGGRLHELSQLSPLNWLRLALIPAGKDWRALPERVKLITGALDARSTCSRREGALGVTSWEGHTHAVIGAASPQNTSLQVADPRLTPRAARQNGGYGVGQWNEAAHAVLATSQVGVSWSSLADPRLAHSSRKGNFGVCGWQAHASTVIGASSAYHGQVMADPRLGCEPRAGAYGVAQWTTPSATVVGSAQHDNSAVSVADERGWPSPTHELREIDGELCLFGPPLDMTSKARALLVIRALDGTWHRPMTTLELAALQSLPTRLDDQWLELEGRSHRGWRQRIGNAIPSATACAIAQSMMRTLDASDAHHLLLSASARWVAPLEEATW